MAPPAASNKKRTPPVVRCPALYPSLEKWYYSRSGPMWQERAGEVPSQPAPPDPPPLPPGPAWAVRLRRHAFLFVLLAILPLGLLLPGPVGACVDWLPARVVVALALFLLAWGLEGRRLWGAIL